MLTPHRPKVGRYIATDQSYIFKTLRANLEANAVTQSRTPPPPHSKKKAAKASSTCVTGGKIEVLELDWETSDTTHLADVLGIRDGGEGEGKGRGVDVLIACDCIYNPTLIEPFVRTCREVCRVGGGEGRGEMGDGGGGGGRKTVVVVAQQIRSFEVFEGWLAEMGKWFRVWRVPDGCFGEGSEGLREGGGFVVHLGVLRDGV